MYRFIPFVLVCVLCFCQFAHAQYSETIQSDRPGQANSVFAAGKKQVILQSGFQFAQVGFSRSGDKTQTSAFANVIRVGLTKRFELGAEITYQHETFLPYQSTLSGISTTSLRLRNHIFTGDGIVPSLGWQANLDFPSISKDYYEPYISPRITVMTSQSFGSIIGLATNWGLQWSGNLAPQGFYVLNLNAGLGDRFSAFVEHYGFIFRNDWDLKYDAGLAFLANNDFQLDVSGGYYFDKEFLTNEEGWFVDCGLSWRL